MRTIVLILLLSLMTPGCNSFPGYDGERINIFPWSLPHGTGRCESPEGWTYTGAWVKGEREGTGTCVYPDGGTYTGEWYEDKRHGPGTYVWPDGLTLNGLWKDGEFSTFSK